MITVKESLEPGIFSDCTSFWFGKMGRAWFESSNPRESWLFAFTNQEREKDVFVVALCPKGWLG